MKTRVRTKTGVDVSRNASGPFFDCYLPLVFALLTSATLEKEFCSWVVVQAGDASG